MIVDGENRAESRTIVLQAAFKRLHPFRPEIRVGLVAANRIIKVCESGKTERGVIGSVNLPAVRETETHVDSGIQAEGLGCRGVHHGAKASGDRETAEDQTVLSIEVEMIPGEAVGVMLADLLGKRFAQICADYTFPAELEAEGSDTCTGVGLQLEI